MPVMLIPAAQCRLPKSCQHCPPWVLSLEKIQRAQHVPSVIFLIIFDPSSYVQRIL